MTATPHHAIRLRAFDDSAEDYRALARVIGAVWSDYPTTADLLRTEDTRREPDQVRKRLLALFDDEVAGFCAFMQYPGSGNEGKYHISINVDPAARRRGIGATCYDALLAGLESIAHDRLVTRTREDQTDALGFLNRRGFEQVMRYPMSRLDLAAFTPHEDDLAKTAPAGIRIASLAELMADYDDWQARCEALEWAIDQDVPSPEPPIRLSLKLYVKRFSRTNFHAKAWHIALDGDDWVGMTTLWPHPPTPERLYTGLTGVLRPYRRRGVATALKLQAFTEARREGFREIETENEQNNPMFDLNLRFGFVAHPAWLAFRKQD